MTEGETLFDAEFDGQEPQTFLTLQSAMHWAEGLECPTGTIAFDGRDIIRYDSGDIALAE
jgi:hypothetical protein